MRAFIYDIKRFVALCLLIGMIKVVSSLHVLKFEDTAITAGVDTENYLTPCRIMRGNL